MTLLQAHEQSRKYFSDDFIEGFNLGAKTQYSRDKEEKVGKWTNNQNGTFTCSICGCKHSRSNYCPNCGAKMR